MDAGPQDRGRAWRGHAASGQQFAVYFDYLDAANGALRFVPCSQHDEPRRLATAYQHSGYDDWPAVNTASAPGDVIAFDLHTFHASFGGRDRLALTVEYLAEPADQAARSRVLRWMDDEFEQDFRGFDRDRYPAWRDWAAGAAGHARRAATLDRLRRAGSWTCRARRRAGKPPSPADTAGHGLRQAALRSRRRRRTARPGCHRDGSPPPGSPGHGPSGAPGRRRPRWAAPS